LGSVFKVFDSPKRLTTDNNSKFTDYTATGNVSKGDDPAPNLKPCCEGARIRQIKVLFGRAGKTATKKEVKTRKDGLNVFVEMCLNA